MWRWCHPWSTPGSLLGVSTIGDSAAKALLGSERMDHFLASGDRRRRFAGSRSESEQLAMLDITELYRLEAKKTLAMLCVFLGDRSEAEDVLQEAFLRVQRSWGRVEDRTKLASYLRSTAFNVARSNLRRRGGLAARLTSMGSWSQSGSAATADHDPTSRWSELREDQKEVFAALLALPDKQRACIVLHYYGGGSVAETASALGISINSAKTHLRRGLIRLRRELEDLQ